LRATQARSRSRAETLRGDAPHPNGAVKAAPRLCQAPDLKQGRLELLEEFQRFVPVQHLARAWRSSGARSRARGPVVRFGVSWPFRVCSRLRSGRLTSPPLGDACLTSTQTRDWRHGSRAAALSKIDGARGGRPPRCEWKTGGRASKTASRL